MITAKLSWVLRVRLVLYLCLGIRHGVKHNGHYRFFIQRLQTFFVTFLKVLTSFILYWTFYIYGTDSNKLTKERHRVCRFIVGRKLHSVSCCVLAWRAKWNLGLNEWTLLYTFQADRVTEVFWWSSLSEWWDRRPTTSMQRRTWRCVFLSTPFDCPPQFFSQSHKS